MIKRYDRETHSEFIKKFKKLFNPQKWDKIVKDNAETYIKHGKFQTNQYLEKKGLPGILDTRKEKNG